MDGDNTLGIRRFLKSGEWFGGLPDALQELILTRSVVRRYEKGQVISLEGCASKGLFALLEGMVHCVRDVGDGEETLIHVCEPGIWFAEYALLSDKPTVATFLARTPAKVLLLPKMQFDHIIAEEPRYYQAFARLALDRYEILVRMLTETRDLTPEARLRGRLVLMAEMRMKERPQDSAVSLAVSQADLAQMIGISRQTLNVLLGELSQAGLIEVGFRRIRVLDAARLADASGVMEAAARIALNMRTRIAHEAPRERVD